MILCLTLSKHILVCIQAFYVYGSWYLPCLDVVNSDTKDQTLKEVSKEQEIVESTLLIQEVDEVPEYNNQPIDIQQERNIPEGIMYYNKYYASVSCQLACYYRYEVLLHSRAQYLACLTCIHVQYNGKCNVCQAFPGINTVAYGINYLR